MPLSYFLDRTFWPTVLYLSAAHLIYTAHMVSSERLNNVLWLITMVLLFRSLARSFLQERKINTLGGRAPARRSYTPFNIGVMLYEAWYFLTNRYDEYFSGLFKMGGRQHPYTCEVVTFGDRAVFTADEENIKAILATQFGDYGKGPEFRKLWGEFLGLSIFSTDGDLWHNSRALLRPQFIRERVSDLQIFEEHIQHLLPLLANGEVCIDDLFLRFTLDSATDFLLGQSVDSLRGSDHSFARAFSKIQHYQTIKSCFGPAAMVAYKKDFRTQLGILNALINKYIDRALELPLEDLEKGNNGAGRYTFLHAIAGHTRDRNELRDQIVAVLLAGRDTTALTLSWLFFQLSRHPRVVKKLQKEIQSTLGKDRIPTYSDLKGMRYLQQNLNETLRLYPVVPYNVRVALKDTTLPRGGGTSGNEPVGIPQGTPVFYSTLVMQRREDIYPPSSHEFPELTEFYPERWENWTPKPWAFIPFNGGPRICIGQQFALTEMAYATVRILQTFDGIEFRMDRAPSWKSDVVLQPNPFVKVAFFKDCGAEC